MAVSREMSDGNEWTADGSNILAPDALAAIRHVLENVGPVIVEHWFYYGGRSPDRLVFEDFDELLAYLRENAKPGDALDIWNFAEVCRQDNRLIEGKYPDAQGRVPKRGAY
jgi:hypothetical protein